MASPKQKSCRYLHKWNVRVRARVRVRDSVRVRVRVRDSVRVRVSVC